MSTEPFIGEIKIFGFNFAPVGYVLCNGSTLSISNYTALFALIGTEYGGDGINTFGVPDLRGRRSIGAGQGPGLPAYNLGQAGGSETIAVLPANLPLHIHTLSPQAATVKVKASSATANQNTASNNFNATLPSFPYYKNAATPGEYIGETEVAGTTEIAGGTVPMPISNPRLVMNFSIAVEGIFPSRN